MLLPYAACRALGVDLPVRAQNTCSLCIMKLHPRVSAWRSRFANTVAWLAARALCVACTSTCSQSLNTSGKLFPAHILYW